MDFQEFKSDAQPWMMSVCYELFKVDVFSSNCLFDLLFDYEFNQKLVPGFSITTPFPLLMGDLVLLNQVCSKNGCFYVIYSEKGFNLSVHFYLEFHG